MARLLIFSAGVVLAMPGGGELGLSHTTLSLIAVALAAVGALLVWTHRRAALAASAPT